MEEIKKIKKRDGTLVDFDQSQITKAIFKASEAVGSPDLDLAHELSQKVVQELKQKVSEQEKVLTVEQVQDVVEQILVKEGQSRIAKAYILYRRQRAKIRKQKQQILERTEIDEVDKRFDLNALRVLKSRYLKKNKKGEVIEGPKQLFQRVATQVVLPSLFYDSKIFQKQGANSHPQAEFDPKKWAKEIKIGKFTLNRFHLQALKKLYDRFNEKGQIKVSWDRFFNLLKQGEFDQYQKEIERYYDLMAERKFMPNTPTLVNFGNHLGMGSACFVLNIEDSLESIMDALKKASIIFKAGGGVGYNFSKLRPEGDLISTTSGTSSGPISFMTLFDKMTDVIKQGGIRRGASMGLLDSDHPDIEKFITAKEQNKALRNFNISVFIKPEFWEYYKKNKPYPLVNPRNGKVVKKVNPRNLFDRLVYQGWESAEPGVIFGETINEHNPFLETLGPIRATNPCVTSDAWVMTSEGPKQVKDLVGKRTKVVVDGKEWSNAGNGFFKTGNKPVYQLKTKEGFELTLTGNHLVKVAESVTRYTIYSEWKQVKDLEPGEKIILNNHQDIEWEGKFGEKEGYLMGHFLGDGTTSEKEFILESWRESKGEKKVRSLIKKYVMPMPHRSDFQGWQFYPKEEKYRLVMAHLREIAKELGIDKGKRITSKIEKASSAFCKGFLRGLFDTDGSVQGTQEKGVSIRLAQSDLEILKAVQRMLLRLGIFSKIYLNRREAGKRKLPDGKGGYKLYQTKAQHELVISCENIQTFYERIGFENSDKLNKLEALLRSYKRRLNRERFVAEVEELTLVGTEKVYDIQIPGINAFDANGFYVHNCGEIPLYANSSCNLGSINVWALTKAKNQGSKREVEFDWEQFKQTIYTATKFLDNVIEVNKYPLPEIKERTLSMRKIGMGMMGLGNLLFDLGIPYDSSKGLNLMENLAEFLTYHSKRASVKLAKQRGKFPLYEKSFYPEGKLPFKGRSGKLPFKLKPWRDLNLDWKKLKRQIKKYGLRNAHTTANAPTGSVSMIAGTSSGIEPVFSLVYEKKVSVGSFYYVNPVFEKIMKREGLFDQDLIKAVSQAKGSVQDLPYIPPELKQAFVTAMDIEAKDHVRALAALQKWIDASISKTINFPAEATIEEMKEAYLLAHKLGCKALTVFRNESIPGVLKAGAKEEEQKEQKSSSESEAEKLTSLEDVKAEGPSIYQEAGVDEEQGPIGQDFGSESEDHPKVCPKCDTELIRKEGCKECPNCGWGICGG